MCVQFYILFSHVQIHVITTAINIYNYLITTKISFMLCLLVLHLSNVIISRMSCKQNHAVLPFSALHSGLQILRTFRLFSVWAVTNKAATNNYVFSPNPITSNLPIFEVNFLWKVFSFLFSLPISVLYLVYLDDFWML